jgi:hypothetical protein
MPHLSSDAKTIKLDAGDTVTVFGVYGKVVQVVKVPATEKVAKSAFFLVDFTRGTGEPTVCNLSDIETVKVPELGMLTFAELAGVVEEAKAAYKAQQEKDAK